MKIGRERRREEGKGREGKESKAKQRKQGRNHFLG